MISSAQLTCQVRICGFIYAFKDKTHRSVRRNDRNKLLYLNDLCAMIEQNMHVHGL